MNYLYSDIIQIKNFLSPEVMALALKIKGTPEEDKNKNYAGTMLPLDPSITEKVLAEYRKHGFQYESLEGARVRVGTHEDINDFRSLVHVDHQCKKVLVVYLENTLYKNPHEAGTLFWEHASTKKKKINMQSHRDIFLHNMVLHRDSTNLDQWKEWLSCPFEVNSAVVFDSLYFHSPPHPGFEKNTPGRRVTLDIFLN